MADEKKKVDDYADYLEGTYYKHIRMSRIRFFDQLRLWLETLKFTLTAASVAVMVISTWYWTVAVVPNIPLENMFLSIGPLASSIEIDIVRSLVGWIPMTCLMIGAYGYAYLHKQMEKGNR